MRNLFAVIVFLPIAACATIAPPRPVTPTTTYIRLPFDTTWTRVVRFFADAQVPIQTIDRSSGVIASGPFRLPADRVEAWADCGTMSNGETAIARLAAIKNFPVITATFNVFLQPTRDSTSVRVNLGLDGTADSPGGPTKLRCVTNGAFERDLVASLAASR